MNPLRYVYIALALLMLGGGAFGVWSYKHMAQEAAQLGPLQAQLNDLQNDYATLSKAVAKRDATDTAVRKDRAAVSTKLDEVQRDKSTPAASWLDTRIPDDVRRVYGSAGQAKPPQR